jgi:hypothetical protein
MTDEANISESQKDDSGSAVNMFKRLLFDFIVAVVIGTIVLIVQLLWHHEDIRETFFLKKTDESRREILAFDQRMLRAFENFSIPVVWHTFISEVKKDWDNGSTIYGGKSFPWLQVRSNEPRGFLSLRNYPSSLWCFQGPGAQVIPVDSHDAVEHVSLAIGAPLPAPAAPQSSQPASFLTGLPLSGTWSRHFDFSKTKFGSLSNSTSLYPDSSYGQLMKDFSKSMQTDSLFGSVRPDLAATYKQSVDDKLKFLVVYVGSPDGYSSVASSIDFGKNWKTARLYDASWELHQYTLDHMKRDLGLEKGKQYLVVLPVSARDQREFTVISSFSGFYSVIAAALAPICNALSYLRPFDDAADTIVAVSILFAFLVSLLGVLCACEDGVPLPVALTLVPLSILALTAIITQILCWAAHLVALFLAIFAFLSFAILRFIEEGMWDLAKEHCKLRVVMWLTGTHHS